MIIDSIKNIIGYTGNDLDKIIAIVSIIVILYFIITLFSILVNVFK